MPSRLAISEIGSKVFSYFPKGRKGSFLAAVKGYQKIFELLQRPDELVLQMRLHPFRNHANHA